MMLILYFKQTVRAMSVAACQRACNRETQCNAINYNSATKRCEMMNMFVTESADCHAMTGNHASGYVYRYKDCAHGEYDTLISQIILRIYL